MLIYIAAVCVTVGLYAFLFASVYIDRWIFLHNEAKTTIYPSEPIHSPRPDNWAEIKTNV